MRELFDRLLQEGEAGIDWLVAERTQESVTLGRERSLELAKRLGVPVAEG